MRMDKPNTWVLGATPEIDLSVYDRANHLITPTEVRLTIKTPEGEITTVSGDGMLTASGYMYYVYRPPVRGWYVYEVWAKDINGMEGTSDASDFNGFEVIDLIN
jgi:hypothetical protein